MNTAEIIAGLMIIATIYVVGSAILSWRENQVLKMAEDKIKTYSVTELRKNIYILKANGLGIRAIARKLSLSTMAIKYLLEDQNQIFDPFEHPSVSKK